MNEGSNLLGKISVSHRAIASIAYQSALESYGVVGFAAKNLAEGIAQVLVKDPSLGVDVQYDGKEIEVNLYIVIEYGTRIISVAESIADQIRYKVEKILGIPVSKVNVNVRGLRISDPD
ncbi:MAG: Asp23/Gls24 family envelope stress response protein [Anaerolineaceae bacterium]|nr:Asp23/Gls24 family envelope stress response protein [Anaerolineaceae bacterium]